MYTENVTKSLLEIFLWDRLNVACALPYSISKMDACIGRACIWHALSYGYTMVPFSIHVIILQNLNYLELYLLNIRSKVQNIGIFSHHKS